METLKVIFILGFCVVSLIILTVSFGIWGLLFGLTAGAVGLFTDW